MQINITAIVRSKPEKIEQVKRHLTEMAIHSKKEKACIQYDLHQDREDPTYFFFHEIWESQEGLDLHETQVYLQNFKAEASELLQEPIKVYKTNRLN